jgi:type I restriction enzyme R subunit
MPEELEWKTRKDRVDRKLTSLHPAWSIVKYRPDLDPSSLHCHAVKEYPTQSGPADYALFVNGRPLGIIEAKKVKLDRPTSGRRGCAYPFRLTRCR